MTERLSQHFTWREIHELYRLTGRARSIVPRCNIEPTATTHVVAAPWSAGNTLMAMPWGLIPSWWTKTAEDVPPTFKVHARGLTEPIFRSAFKRGRCIIPASGYYQWKTVPDRQQCYYVNGTDGGVLSIAGVCDEWKNIETGDVMPSCSVIITAANSFMRSVHHQMPALLHERHFERWLSGAAGTEVLKPADEDYLRMCLVSNPEDHSGRADDPPPITKVST